MVLGPLTLFCVTSVPPLLPVMLSGPWTWLPVNLTPPRLPVSTTDPEKVLPGHAAPDGFPTTTGPLDPSIETGPRATVPQMVIAAAPLLLTGPGTTPPFTHKAPPEDTVIGPLIVPPEETQTAWPAPIDSDPTLVVEMHGCEKITAICTSAVFVE